MSCSLPSVARLEVPVRRAPEKPLRKRKEKGLKEKRKRKWVGKMRDYAYSRTQRDTREAGRTIELSRPI